jgi:hypothetical protein
MTRTKRYFSVENPTQQNFLQLEAKRFIELPDAVRPGADKILLVDIKNRNYWRVDPIMLEHTKNLLTASFDEDVNDIKNEQLTEYLK